jgi:hypothetical protein
MNVELPVAEAVGVADRPLDRFRAQHLGVEGVRASPVGDVNDAVIELYGKHPF